MRRWLGNRVAIVVLVAMAIGAAAKPKKKKKAKTFLKGAGDGPQTPQVNYRAECDAEKAQLQTQIQSKFAEFETQHKNIVKQYADGNQRAVEAHNKLATEFNDLLKRHSELIKKFNELVSELQDPSLANFVGAKAIKAYHHPGIEGAVNKTFIHVLPAAQKVLLKGEYEGALWFNQTQASVQEFLQNHGGEAIEDWLPIMSGVLVYGSVLIPIAISCWCVLEFVCKLEQLVVFGHIYLAVAGLCAGAFAVGTGRDPLSTFAEQDPQLYEFAQVVFALMLVLYGAVNLFSLGCGHGSTEWRIFNLLVIVAFDAAYYTLIWTPAMVDEMPRVSDFVHGLVPEKNDEHLMILTAAPYLAVSLAFAILFLFESTTSAPAVAPEEKEDKDQ